MNTKLALFIIVTILCSTFVFSQQQKEIIKLVPYKTMPGVSAEAVAPGDCSG